MTLQCLHNQQWSTVKGHCKSKNISNLLFLKIKAIDLTGPLDSFRSALQSSSC
jgi:hypothetical protein